MGRIRRDGAVVRRNGAVSNEDSANLQPRGDVSSIILGAGLLAMVCNSAAFFDVEQRYSLL